MNTDTWAWACVHGCIHTHVQNLGRTFCPASLAPSLARPRRHSSDFFLLPPTRHLPPWHFITFHLPGYHSNVPTSPTTLPPSPRRAGSQQPIIFLSHFICPLPSPHGALPPTHRNFLPGAPSLPPSCLPILNLASISHSLPRPGRCRDLPVCSLGCNSPPGAQLAPWGHCLSLLDLFRDIRGQLVSSDQNSLHFLSLGLMRACYRHASQVGVW